MRYFILVLSVIFSTSVMAEEFKTVAKNAVLMDYDTGEILFEKEAYEMVPPSSMSKMMTSYITFDKIKKGLFTQETQFSVSDTAAYRSKTGESAMYLKSGKQVSVIDLLYGVIIMSGGDACRTLAENISGSVDGFVMEMNNYAKKLGLKNSTFANPTGAYHPNHLMSVYDVAELSRRTIQDFPEFYGIFKEKYFDYKGYSESEKKEYEFAMWNRNKLLWLMPNADGLKTGHTDQGGYSLAATAKSGNRRLIAVVNGLNLKGSRADCNTKRARAAQKLLNYGFNNFTNYKFYNVGDKVIDVPVWFGKEKIIPVTVNRNVVITLPKGEHDDITLKVSYDTPVVAPIQKGQKVGTVTVFIGDKEKQTIDLVAKNDMRKVYPVLRLFENIKQIFLKILN